MVEDDAKEMDQATIDDMAAEEAAARRDHLALEQQQADFEREERDFEEQMSALAEQVEGQRRAAASRSWDDWAMYDEMHRPRGSRKRQYVDVTGPGAQVVGQALRLRASSSGMVRLSMRIGMESSSEAETIPAASTSVPTSGEPTGGLEASSVVPMDFQGFQRLFQEWRSKQIDDDEVRKRYGPSTLDLLEAQLLVVEDGRATTQGAEAGGLADTLLDAIVEEAGHAQRCLGEPGGEPESRVVPAVQQPEVAATSSGATWKEGQLCAGLVTGVLTDVSSGSMDVVPLVTGRVEGEGEVVGASEEGVAEEDTDEEEREWQELLGARAVGGWGGKSRRDRSD